MFTSAAQRNFLCILALLFVASLSVTLAWGGAMADMDAGLPMPGGWTLSMAWMPVCGQSWATAMASFIGMWSVMTVAMMLPAVAPMLWHWRQTIHHTTPDVWMLLAASGYFAIWIGLGLAIFVLGAAMSELMLREMALARKVPIVAGMAVLGGGVFQLSRWKARHLASCRDMPAGCAEIKPGIGPALRYGLRYGWNCIKSCAGLMVILLAIGVMNIWAMMLITLAIAMERLMPEGRRIAGLTGVAAIAAGLCLLLQSVWF
jgi:predicted metal-binding membrane protein